MRFKNHIPDHSLVRYQDLWYVLLLWYGSRQTNECITNKNDLTGYIFAIYNRIYDLWHSINVQLFDKTVCSKLFCMRISTVRTTLSRRPWTIKVGHKNVSFDEWDKLTFPKIGGDIDNLRWFLANNLGHESVLIVLKWMMFPETNHQEVNIK